MIGTVGLSGVSLEEMTAVSDDGSQPLVDAFVTSIADSADVPEQRITIDEINAARRMGISVEFTISISTASAGTSAMASISGAVSNGDLAQTFTTESSLRGQVVDVTAALTNVYMEEEPVVIVPSKVSDAEYGLVVSVLLCVGIGVAALWGFILWDVIRVRRALARRKSNRTEQVTEGNPVYIQSDAILLDDILLDDKHCTDDSIIDDCGRDVQGVFMSCG